MKRYSTSLFIRGNANQNHNAIPPHTCQNGYYQQITSISEDVENEEPLCTGGGNTNWCKYYGKQMEGSQKIKNRTTKNQVDAAIPLLDSYPKQMTTLACKYMFVYIYSLCCKVLNGLPFL